MAAFDPGLEVRDIHLAMAWNFLSPKGLASPKRALRDARDSLVLSLTRPRERRGEFRLFNQAVGTRAPANGEMLLNVSRSGLAVGIRKRCTFARGEHYRVILDDGKRRADLEGTVCWTRSTWPQESTGSNGGEYFQAAGLAIDDPLPPEQQEHWRALRELVQEGWVALDVKVLPVR